MTTASALVAGWSYTLMNGLVPGTGASNRIGREIFMTKMDMYINVGATSRYMIVYDKQSNGANPAANDLTEDSTDRFSPQNFSNKDRFDILWDSLYDLTPEQNVINIHKNFELNLATYYNAGTAGTVADITSGALFVAVWFAGASVAPSFSAMLYFEE